MVDCPHHLVYPLPLRWIQRPFHPPPSSLDFCPSSSSERSVCSAIPPFPDWSVVDRRQMEQPDAGCDAAVTLLRTAGLLLRATAPSVLDELHRKPKKSSGTADERIHLAAACCCRLLRCSSLKLGVSCTYQFPVSTHYSRIRINFHVSCIVYRDSHLVSRVYSFAVAPRSLATAAYGAIL